MVTRCHLPGPDSLPRHLPENFQISIAVLAGFTKSQGTPAGTKPRVCWDIYGGLGVQSPLPQDGIMSSEYFSQLGIHVLRTASRSHSSIRGSTHAQKGLSLAIGPCHDHPPALLLQPCPERSPAPVVDTIEVPYAPLGRRSDRFPENKMMQLVESPREVSLGGANRGRCRPRAGRWSSDANVSQVQSSQEYRDRAK